MKNRGHRKRRSHWWLLLATIALGYVGYCLLRPLPPIALDKETIAYAQTKVDLAWPANTENAIGTLSAGVLATNSPHQHPRPTASIAKLITALTVLKKHPLKLGEQGPTITLGQRDVALYNEYYLEHGSLVEVETGEKISEYDALEAMLLPSANNMADSLAIWAYGSLANYRVAAQKLVNQLQLRETTVGTDASGLDPSTISTPSDLIKLGQIVLNNPVLKQIVGKKTAKVPVAGTIHNVNYLVGSGPFIGIKTGNSDEAGGNLLFAANYLVSDSRTITVIGAIMHDKTPIDAMRSAIPLLNSAKGSLVVENIIKSHQKVAQYSAPWLDSPVPIRAENNLSLATWRGQKPPIKIDIEPVKPPALLNPGATIPSGSTVGSAKVANDASARSVSLVTGKPINAPSIFWLLTHPF